MLTPSLVIPLGNVAESAVEKLKTRLSFGEIASERLVRFLSPTADIIDYAEVKEVHSAYVKNIPTFIESAVECSQTLISDENLRDLKNVRKGYLHVIIIGSEDWFTSVNTAEEATTLGASVLLAESLKESLKARLVLPALVVDIIGLFFLPDEISAKDAQRYAWLKELAASYAFSKIFFLSPSNYDPKENKEGAMRLDSSQMEHLASEVVVTILSTGILERIDEIIGLPRPKYYSMGVSTLFFPSSALIAYKSDLFAGELLSYYLNFESPSTKQEVDDFLNENDLTTARIYERLIETSRFYRDESVIAKLRFEPLFFKKVPLESLPERIASYGDYLGYEKLRLLAKQVSANLDNIKENAQESLVAATDAIVANPPLAPPEEGNYKKAPSPKKAIDFLRRLWEKALEDKDFVARFTSLDTLDEELHPIKRKRKKKKEESDSEIPNLQEYHDRLRKAIEHRPLWQAVLARYFLLGLVLAYAVQLFIGIISKHSFLMNLGFFANSSLWFVAVFCFSMLIGGLVILRAHIILQRRIFAYMDAVIRKHVLELKKYILGAIGEFYQTFLSAIGNPYEEQNEPESERQKVKDFTAAVKEISDELKRSSLNLPSLLFYCSIMDSLEKKPSFPFRQQEKTDFQKILAEFAEQDNFIGWRKIIQKETEDTEKHQFKQHAVAFSQKGYEYINNVSILELLKTNSAAKNEEILKAFKIGSYVYLTVAAGMTPPNVLRFFIFDEAGEKKIDSLFTLDEMRKLLVKNQHRLSLCQVAWDVELKAVEIFSHWKSAYEKFQEKEKLHFVPNWEQLPDPLTSLERDIEGEAEVDVEEEVV